MKVLVLGGGVIGVSTAWYLARAGHEVELVDRQPGPALETSFANAGEVSPGYSAPWAGPGVPVKAIKWMLMTHSPLVIWPLLDPDMWRWGAGHAGQLHRARLCAEQEPHGADRRIQPRLPEGLRAEVGITYDDRAQGTLQLFRTQAQLDGIAKDVEVLKQYGVPFEVLDREGFCRVEPALRLTQEKFVGALRLPGDETGDCFLFTNRLAEMAAGWACSSAGTPSITGLQCRRPAHQRRAHLVPAS
jgi:D-amino-acid dehydrogenase